MYVRAQQCAARAQPAWISCPDLCLCPSGSVFITLLTDVRNQSSYKDLGIYVGLFDQLIDH